MQDNFETFYKKQLTEDVTMGSAGMGSAETQFSGDHYAPGDSRNLFGIKNDKPKIIKRPKIENLLQHDKKRKRKTRN